ncbi:DUF3383 domain-containing protein [Testudinibacter sp. P80/BLE/0925]
MFQSIPASQIVSVNPAVLSSGGSPLSMNAVFLSKNTNLITGEAVEFASANSVGDYFGLASAEYDAAVVYFSGFDNSTIKPGSLYFCAYNEADEASFLLGSSVKSLSLEALKAVSGTLTVTVDGTAKNADELALAEATSFSDAASIIETALDGVKVSFDPQLQAFKVESKSTGSSSTITHATGTTADVLGLSKKSGATISKGAPADTPVNVMQSVLNSTLNWATFTTVFEPSLADKLAFAKWSNGQNNRYLYVGWGVEAEATQTGNTTCFGAQLKEAAYDGACAVYGGLDKAAFICGAVASIDFTERQGRITLKFKGQSGLKADVTDETIAQNLEKNGYNYYGAWATKNDRFLFLAPGQLSGKWKWIDSFINQIRINSQLQLALITLLTSTKSVPYNATGIALQRAACTDPINEALNFGSIQTGVALSEQQAAIIKNEAGYDAKDLIEAQGYCLHIAQATAQTRGNRQSMPMKLWYTDGGSVHSINLSSINVQ